MTKYRRPRCLTNLFHDLEVSSQNSSFACGTYHKVEYAHYIRFNVVKHAQYCISFHVPQAKEQMLLYKFPEKASLMVDPASPRAPNDQYSTFN
jgi:hypothetical protein